MTLEKFRLEVHFLTGCFLDVQLLEFLVYSGCEFLLR